MMTSAEFLAKIEAHLTDTKTSASRFGKDVLGDPSFVFELRDGRSPSLSVVNKILNHISERESKKVAA